MPTQAPPSFPVPAPRTVRCPTCGALVEWTAASRWRPFCSERCRTVDLGAWASERYRVPAAERDDDEDAATGGGDPPSRPG